MKMVTAPIPTSSSSSSSHHPDGDCRFVRKQFIPSHELLMIDRVIGGRYCLSPSQWLVWSLETVSQQQFSGGGWRWWWWSDFRRQQQEETIRSRVNHLNLNFNWWEQWIFKVRTMMPGCHNPDSSVFFPSFGTRSFVWNNGGGDASSPSWQFLEDFSSSIWSAYHEDDELRDEDCHQFITELNWTTMNSSSDIWRIFFRIVLAWISFFFLRSDSNNDWIHCCHRAIHSESYAEREARKNYDDFKSKSILVITTVNSLSFDGKSNWFYCSWLAIMVTQFGFPHYYYVRYIHKFLSFRIFLMNSYLLF